MENDPKQTPPDQTPTIGALASALALAQSEMEGAKKDSNNPFFHSTYADLKSVWAACRGPLTKNKLAVIQTTLPHPEGVLIQTTLAHASGEWIRGSLFMRPVKNDPQGIGSCITYARRYALSAIVGISPEDDDAEGAHGRDRPAKPPATPKPAKTNPDAKAPPPETPAPANQDLLEYPWQDSEVPFGKNKGKKLGSLPPKVLHWYTSDDPDCWLGKKKAEMAEGKKLRGADAELYTAVLAYHAQKAAAEGSQPDPTYQGPQPQPGDDDLPM